jgi:hypothetical protein
MDTMQTNESMCTGTSTYLYVIRKRDGRWGVYDADDETASSRYAPTVCTVVPAGDIRCRWEILIPVAGDDGISNSTGPHEAMVLGSSQIKLIF